MKPNGSFPGTRIGLAIADANLMAGRLLSDQLKRYPEFYVASCDGDRASLLKSIEKSKPAVALVSTDLQDGQSGGLAAIREIREIYSAVRPIVLCNRPEPNIVLEALRSGARGLFSRCNFDAGAIRKCIRRVFEGQLWLGNLELEFLVDALGQSRPLRAVNAEGVNLLSRREEQVMHLVADGLGNREIAERLNLSEHTVKNYMFHIFDKLGISNRVELVLYAVSNPRRDQIPSSSQKDDAVANAS